MGSPCRRRSSGSGCPRRTVRRPSCESHRLLCVRVCGRSVCIFPHPPLIVNRLFMQNEGIAAFVMLTKNTSADNESARRPIRIGGCDSTFLTMCILSGSLKQSRAQIVKPGRSAACEPCEVPAGCSGLDRGGAVGRGSAQTLLIFCRHVRARSSSVAVPVSCCSRPAPLSVEAAS